MSLILPSLKKRKLARRKNSKKLKKANSVYLVYYDIQNFSIELTHPIITFKSLKAAEIYIENRNFEFQTLMLASRNAQQSYVLDSLKAIFNEDFCITVSDLRLAGDYFQEEYSRLIMEEESEEEMEKVFWSTLQKQITPFKLTTIEHVSNDYV